ncbi:ATP-binding protein, partial [Akkermansiaceae bacterium]|nr:ATP-binding protein [Akkermansiaceae bacterium]
MDTTQENLPDPGRLIVGLRDTGYNFNSAAADIIDNCIAAEANNVHVRMDLLPTGEKIIYFGDDGKGMDQESLHNAMRYGADRRENSKSLGKFGLGLKTASSSVCKKFSLISRNAAGKDLLKLTWDLEHVETANLWEMLTEGVTGDEEAAFEELCGDTGTLVVWKSCDRVLNSNDHDPGSTKEKQALGRVAKRLAVHCSLVFHKYLDASDKEQRTISLTI